MKTGRVCLNCKAYKDYELFSKITIGKPKLGYHSTCKSCRSIYATNKARERKLELFPNLYVQCDECDWIRSFRKPKCRNCGSEEKVA